MSRNKTFKVLIAASILFLLGIRGGMAEDTSVLYPQQFHVKGNKIVNGEGKETVFRGFATIDLIYQYYASSEEEKYHDDDFIPWDETYFKKISEWGATIIRLPVNPVMWETHGKEKSLEILDQAIQ